MKKVKTQAEILTNSQVNVKVANKETQNIQLSQDDLLRQIEELRRLNSVLKDQLKTVTEELEKFRQETSGLRYHAETDPLTKLVNRRLFFQKLDDAVALASRFNDNIAVMYLDLDGFKQVNDHFGHGQGDIVLIEVANRLRECVREVDTVARLGGDEFAIILTRTSKVKVTETAQRIIDSLVLNIEENGCHTSITVSVGIAIYPDDSINPLALLKHADAAMYKAKEQGKRKYCWHSGSSKIENP